MKRILAKRKTALQVGLRKGAEMENKLYFRDFPCYDSASEKCRNRIGKKPYYDLELLSEPRMREEAKAFIEYQSRYLSLETM